MSQFAAYRVALCLGAGSLFVSCGTLWSQTSGISQELRELREQNLELKKQLQQQQGMIEALSRKVDQMERPEGKEKSDGHSEPEDGKTDSMLTAAAASTLGRINISGEG